MTIPVATTPRPATGRAPSAPFAGREDPCRSDPIGPARPPPSMRVGVDLVAVAEVARSVERFGERYLDRIFTPHELACCRSCGGRRAPAGLSAESLAARFAAKEATVKVLRPVGHRPEWRSIEVHRSDAGWCEIRLSGRAAALAADARLGPLSVSLTHESTMAAAVVVGASGAGGREEE